MGGLSKGGGRVSRGRGEGPSSKSVLPPLSLKSFCPLDVVSAKEEKNERGKKRKKPSSLFLPLTTVFFFFSNNESAQLRRKGKGMADYTRKKSS